MANDFSPRWWRVLGDESTQEELGVLESPRSAKAKGLEGIPEQALTPEGAGLQGQPSRQQARAPPSLKEKERDAAPSPGMIGIANHRDKTLTHVRSPRPRLVGRHSTER